MTQPETTKPLLAYLEAGEIEIRTGPFGTQLKASEYVHDGTPVINVRNIGFGSLRPEKLEYLPEKVAIRLHQHRLRAGDIVFGRKGAVERHLLVKADQAGWIQGSDCIRVRIISGSLNPRFLSYCLLLEEHQSWIQSQASHGATMATLNQGIIERIRVPERTTSEQQRIVAILSAYDELIEVNQRRIAILEDMARRLFDEWFVRFRYPGHEAVPLVETKLGMVPEGWTPGTFCECVDVNPETLSPRKAPAQIHYIDISSVSVGRVDGVTTMKFSDAPGRARRVIRNGDVIWSTVRPNRRSHALLLDVASDTVASTGFAALRSRNSDWAWVYEATRTDAFVGFLVGRARGSAYPAVVGADFEDVPLIVPPLDLRCTFQTQVGPIHELASTLYRQNNKLRAARDLLLPKLISGQIDVPAAEETFAEAAE